VQVYVFVLFFFFVATTRKNDYQTSQKARLPDADGWGCSFFWELFTGWEAGRGALAACNCFCAGF
jgi:hypothetical protein